MRAQELFPSESRELLNDTCLELLAHALSSPCGVQWSTCTRFNNGYHFQHGSISVVDQLPPPSKEEAHGPSDGTPSKAAVIDEEPYSVKRHTYDAASASLHLFLRPLVLETSRLQQPVMMRLIHFLRPRSEMKWQVTEIFDRDAEASPMPAPEAGGGRVRGERAASIDFETDPEPGEVPLSEALWQ